MRMRRVGAKEAAHLCPDFATLGAAAPPEPKCVGIPSVAKEESPLRPEDIAEIIVFVLGRPPHVNIADLMVMCLDQASSTVVNKKTS